MNFENIITYALIGVVVSLFVAYMNKAASKPVAANAEGQSRLRIHKLYQIIGWASIVMGVAFFIATVFLEDRPLLIAGAIFLIAFGAMGYFLLLYYQNHSIAFDDRTMTITSWRGKPVTMTWEEIGDIRFNPISGYLKITGNSGPVTVHMHLVGLGSFLQMMEQKTKWRAKELKLPMRV